MAAVSDIVIRTEKRPCLVNLGGKQEKALFHKFLDGAGAIVELEDGCVLLCQASIIQFCDRLIDQFCFERGDKEC